jgi:hypothetical protein
MRRKQGDAKVRPKNIARLRQQFSEAISIGAEDEVRRLYRELLSAGETSKELLNTAALALYKDRLVEPDDRSIDALPNAGVRSPAPISRMVNLEQELGPVTTASEPQGSTEHQISASIDRVLGDGEQPMETARRGGANISDGQSTQLQAGFDGSGSRAEFQSQAGHELEPEGDIRQYNDEVGQSLVVPAPHSADSLHSRPKWRPPRGSRLGIGLTVLVIPSLAIALLLHSRTPTDGHFVTKLSNNNSTSLATETPTEAAATPIVESSSSQTTNSPVRPFAESPEEPAVDPTSPAAQAEAGSIVDNTRSQMAQPNREPNSSALSAATIAPSGETTTASSPAAIGPDGKHLSDAEILALIHRGDSLFALGDIASARLFYERAARGGSGQAALRLGGTFDSSFLLRAGFGGIRGDSALASRWYQLALELGAGDADTLLKSLQNK